MPPRIHEVVLVVPHQGAARPPHRLSAPLSLVPPPSADLHPSCQPPLLSRANRPGIRPLRLASGPLSRVRGAPISEVFHVPNPPTSFDSPLKKYIQEAEIHSASQKVVQAPLNESGPPE
jgi:hypothetical protein